jgi:hypothetical protein
MASAGSAVLLQAQEKTAPTEGAAFWKYITETNPYTKWKMWPGMEEMYPGTSPHGAFLKLYVNDKAYQAIKDKKAMPNGAILVKENYGEDKKTLMAVTPMYKVAGYNPAAGDWFWAKINTASPPKGEVEASGKVQGCIDCHKTQKDFLFTGKETK